MATKSKATFQKRQKEMKRQEKQRMKAARRAQKKLESKAAKEGGIELTGAFEDTDILAPTETEPETEPES
jgi:hypothetical protein